MQSDPPIESPGAPKEPGASGDWLDDKRATYSKWMKLLAVAAVIFNVAAEGHDRQFSSFQLPETIAPVVSYLAAANASLFTAGAVLGLMIYLNERLRR